MVGLLRLSDPALAPAENFSDLGGLGFVRVLRWVRGAEDSPAAALLETG